MKTLTDPNITFSLPFLPEPEMCVQDPFIMIIHIEWIMASGTCDGNSRPAEALDSVKYCNTRAKMQWRSYWCHFSHQYQHCVLLQYHITPWKTWAQVNRLLCRNQETGEVMWREGHRTTQEKTRAKTVNVQFDGSNTVTISHFKIIYLLIWINYKFVNLQNVSPFCWSDCRQDVPLFLWGILCEHEENWLHTSHEESAGDLNNVKTCIIWAQKSFQLKYCI